jgi:hypothetical protein
MQIRSNSSPKRGFHFGLQPALAWIAILGLVFFSAVCILAHAGSVLRIAFPLGSLVLGVILYFRYPVLYLGFTWWLWFLTPFVRRLVDYQSGWQDPSVVLLSPFLATIVTFYTFVLHSPKSYYEGGLPFILAFIAVLYSFLIGVVNGASTAALVPLLNWLTPILFGFHLFVHWRDYPSYRQNIQRTFMWGVLVTGAYGVLQYMVAPAWDRFWITSAHEIAVGVPEPLGFRVFSTMNSPGPFALVTMAGLLLLFNSKGTLLFPSAAVGYLSFLLSLVRSAWIGWSVGLISLFTSLKASFQIRLIITILVMGICVLPLTTIEPFSHVINTRIETLSKPSNDISYNERSETYDRSFGLALSQGIGVGMGVIDRYSGLILDSGILEMLFTLGWLGTIPYVSGIVLILFNLWQSSAGRFDPFVSTARAVSTGALVQIVLGNVLIGLPGMVVWCFLGIAMAGNNYYRHQRTASLKRS